MYAELGRHSDCSFDHTRLPLSALSYGDPVRGAYQGDSPAMLKVKEVLEFEMQTAFVVCACTVFRRNETYSTMKAIDHMVSPVV